MTAYVIRRLWQIIPTIAGMYREDYPEVVERGEAVIAILVKEEKAFRQTLRKGIKQLGTYAETGITGTELFTLYDTYGFPVELSTEEAAKAGIVVSGDWRAKFDEQMAAQRARSQGASKMKI